MTHLAASAPDWNARGAPVSVLGAGGAARAIVYGLLEAGVGEVRVFNRTRARAEALAAHFGPRVKVSRLGGARPRARAMRALLVNTTSIGLKGEGSLGDRLRRLRSRLRRRRHRLRAA